MLFIGVDLSDKSFDSCITNSEGDVLTINKFNCQWHNINVHLCRNKNELLWRRKIHIYGVKCLCYGYLSNI